MEWGIFISWVAAAIPALFDEEYRKGFVKGVVLAALVCFILAVVFI